MTPTPLRELHLPDLPEVQVNLGGASEPPAPGQGPRPAMALGYRLRQALSSYLPLLLLALLAVSTWWLVTHTPQAPGPSAEAAPRQTPDYTMSGFAITRFAPNGQVVLQLAGDQLRHFPITDQLEIEGVRIQAIAPDGRVTDATARRALANGDGSEVQLLGGAKVTSQLNGTDVLDVQGEFLHAFLRFERLRSHLPVQVRRGGTEIHAGGLDYDNVLRQLQLSGPVRSVMLPSGWAGTALSTPPGPMHDVPAKAQPPSTAQPRATGP